jgi:hypothetical protein
MKIEWFFQGLIRSTHKKQEAQRCQKRCCLFYLSSLKPLGQLEPNLVGMFIWWFYEKWMVFFFGWSEVHKRNKRFKGVKKGIVCFNRFSETTGSIGTKFGRNVYLMVLWEVNVFLGWSDVHKRNKRPKGVKNYVVCFFVLYT